MSSIEPQKKDGEPRSAFGRMLAADPALRARCEENLRILREAARPDIEACLRSEMLTAEDFGVVINARTEDMWNDGTMVE